MALEHVPRCQHVKVNGVQCGSPALRHGAHCFFHTRVEYERQIAVENHSGTRSFGFPLLEDANSVQVALMKVIQMLGSGVLDHKTAGLMLYALQTASYNLRNARFEPEKLTEVVIDEDTVDLTRVKGPQWSARDFGPVVPAETPGEAQSKNQSEVQSEVQNEARRELRSEVQSKVQSEAHSEAQKAERPAQGEAHAPLEAGERKNSADYGPVLDKRLADVLRRREQKRKLPLVADEDEPKGAIQSWLQELGVFSEQGVPVKLENQLASKSESGDLAAESQTVAVGSS